MAMTDQGRVPPAALAGVAEQARSAGFGWGGLAAVALGSLGVSLSLGAISRLERRLRSALADQPDPMPLLEDIDLSQQNLHLGFAGLEKSVRRGVGEMLAPLEAHVNSMNDVAGSLSEQSATAARALEVRLAASEASFAAAIGELRAETERRTEIDRSAFEARQLQLEQALAERLQEMSLEIARAVEDSACRSIEQSVDSSVNQSVGQAVSAMEHRIQAALASQMSRLAAQGTEEAKGAPAGTTQPSAHSPAVQPMVSAAAYKPEPFNEDLIPLEQAAEQVESVAFSEQTYSPQPAAPQQPLLEPEDARALAETGFHRVSSLGLLQSLDDEVLEGEASTESDTPGADAARATEVQDTETRSGIEVQVSSPAMSVDEMPHLRAATDRATEGLRLHGDLE